MRSFPEYIEDPGLVERTLIPVKPFQIETINSLSQTKVNEELDMLDLAIDLELQSLVLRQPNLSRVLGALAGHYRITQGSDAPTTVSRYVEEGFAVGLLVSQKGFKFPKLAINWSNKPTADDLMGKTYYKDVQPATREVFEAMDTWDMELLLHTITNHTQAATESLRQGLDHDFEIERRTPELAKARTVGAVTAYSLMTHERIRARNEWTKNQKAHKKAAAKKKRLQQTETHIFRGETSSLNSEVKKPKSTKRYMPFRLQMLETIPMAIRRELEANRIEKHYWQRIMRSSGLIQKP